MSLKDVNRLLKLDPNNTELLTQKQKLLQSAIQDTSKRLKTLREANEKATASMKNYDAWKNAYDPIKTDIDRVKKKISELKSEMKELEDAGEVDTSAYKDLQDKLTNATKELGKLKKQAKEVNDEFGNPISTQQYDALQREIVETEIKLQNLGKSFEETENKAKKTNDGFTTIKGTIANLASDVISGAVKKVGELAQSFLDLSETTEEFRTMQAKLEGAADTFGYNIDFASEKYKQFYEYLGDDQMTTNAVTNLMGLKVSTETLSNLANSAIGVWSAYGDSIPIESLTESMNESAQVAKVTGVLADALNWAGISEDDFNKKLESCNSVQERADAIAQTLNSTYGKSKRKFDELSGSLLESKSAQLELKETQAELGKTLEPVNTALTEMKTQSLQNMKPIVEGVATAFQNLMKWMKEHQTVVVVLKAVMGGLITTLGLLGSAFAIHAVIQLATAAVKKMTKSMTALNITMSVNPILLIVTAIAGLIVAFISLWNNCEGFRNFWINLWENIKKAAGSAIQGIKDFFVKTIPEAFENFKQKCSDTIQAVGEFFAKLPETIRKKLSEIISSISEWGQNFWNSLTVWVSNTVNNITEWFSTLPEKIRQKLNEVISNISEWGQNFWNSLTIWVSKTVEAVVQFFSDLPYKIGFMLGYVLGTIAKWGIELYNYVATAIPKVIEAVVQFFSDLPYKIGFMLGYVLGTIAKWGIELYNYVATAIPKVIEAVVQFFSNLPEKIWNILVIVVTSIGTWISEMAAKALDFGSQFITPIINFFATLPATIWTWLVNVITLAGQWVLEMVGKALEMGSQFLQNVIVFFSELPGNVWNWLVNTINNVSIWVPEMISKAKEMGTEFLQNVITFFSELPGNVWNWLVNTINNVSIWVPEMISKAKEMGTEFLQNVITFFSELPGNVWKWLVNTINKVKEFVSDMARKASEAGQKFFDNLVNKVKEIPGQMLNIGKNIVSGIWEGISGSFDWIIGKIGEFCDGFLGGFLTALGINSPSKVFEDASEWIPEGIVKGVKNKTKNVVNAIKTMSKEMTGAFSVEVPKGNPLGGLNVGNTLNAMVTATSPNVNVNNMVTVQVGNRQFEAYIVRTAQNGITKQQIARNRAKGR